jgi:hypothetical protein
MDKFIRPEMKKVFPESDFVELPYNHPIYNQEFSFKNGLPKIHEHDGLSPKALGYFHEGKLILLFTFESDLGDGWEDANVHNDPETVRLRALKMGANIIKYAFEN